MNKKFLSAILFGALMVTSTGTFVSCKDYDDDIDQINATLTDLKSQIAALQTEVNGGNWVTSLTPVTGGFTVTFKDGKSYTIVNGKDGAEGKPGADGKPGTDGKGTEVKITEDGFWEIDGVKTEYIAVKKTDLNKVNVPYVEDGYWVFFDEEGNKEVSDIKAKGAAYVVEANGVYTLNVPDADGEMQTVELPTAASMISALTPTLSGENNELDIQYFTFKPFQNVADNEKDDYKKAWKGTKAITTDEYIISSDEYMDVRIDPVSVDAKTIPFGLVDSQNNIPSKVDFTAFENSGLITRAAYGNGLYWMFMKQATLKNDEALTAFTNQFTAKVNNVVKNRVYALNANKTFRSDYLYTVKVASATNFVFAPIYLNTTNTAITNDKAIDADLKVTVADKTVVVNAGEANTLFVSDASRLYDMWLSASTEYVNEFGLVFDQTVPSFTITKNPDKITAANFPLTIHVMDNQGKVQDLALTVKLSEAIDTSAEYKLIEHVIKSEAKKNYFSANLDIMKTALGNKLDSWKIKVDLKNTDVKFYNENLTTEITMSGINAYVASKIENGTGNNIASGVANANYMKFDITNVTASQKFEVGKIYNAVVTFNTEKNEKVNSIVIPFRFSIPTLASMFEKEPAVFKGDVAYAYMNIADQTRGESAYKLERAFAKYPAGVAIALDDETAVVGDDVTSKGLATIAGTFTANAMVTLIDNVDSKDGDRNGLELGYGKELIVNASAADFEGWTYADNDGKYTFKIKVMSPIYEGSVSAIKTVVEIPATSVDGYKVGNKDIEGKTYNNIAYKVLQDKVADWSRPEISKVEAKTDNKRVVNIADEVGKISEDWVEAVAGKKSTDGKTFYEGYINVKPENIENTTETQINVKVTDVWGYAKVNPIKVKVTVK